LKKVEVAVIEDRKMDEVRDRLKKCFAAVFPNIPVSEIESSSQGTIEEWDSIAMVTLITVVEEEFGQPLDLEDIPNLNSFESLRRYLTKTNGTRL
jgi:acyl carrier protein